MDDPHQLQRFVNAQAPIYAAVRAELGRGRKTSHWMWFIFPQLRGLGTSDVARRFAIGSKAEARAYLDHPLLGSRLRECTRLVNEVQGRSLTQIFGPPDDMKFRSSISLFALVAPADGAFREALDKYCGSQLDPRTEQLFAALPG